MNILSKLQAICLRYSALLLFVCILPHNLFAHELGEDLLVALAINYQETDVLSEIIHSPKGILVPLEDLTNFNIKNSYLEDNSILIGKKKYFNLKSASKTIHELNRFDLKLSINFPAEAMKEQFLEGKEVPINREDHEIKKSTGAFLNYDLLFTRSNLNSISSVQDVNYFTPDYTLTHSYFLRVDETKNRRDSGITRLDTYVAGDIDKNVIRWQLGDSSTKSSSWSGGTRFAGFQYGTYFAMKPGFSSFPLTDFVSVADTPSKVEVYSNSIPVYTTNVGIGEFKINDLPITGNGDLVIKTTDMNGKVRTFNMPYYIDTTILAKDVHSYSISTGFQRQEYGIENYKYKSYILSTDYMKGITDNWTSGGHIDFRSISSKKNLAAAGLTNIYNMDQYGVVTASIANSFPKMKNAYKYSINYNNRWKDFNFSTGFGFAADEFMIPYSYPISSGSGKNMQIGGGYANQKFGALTVNYSTFSPGGQEIRIISANYSRNLTKSSFIRLGIGKSIGQDKSTSIGLSYGLNLDKLSGNIDITKSDSGYEKSFSLAKPINGALGYGYRASATKSDNYRRYDLQFDRNFSKVETSIFLFDQDRSKQTQQLDFRGSVIAADGNLFFSRPFYGSLAIVKAGGYPNITVYKNNNPVGQTDKNGNFVITDIVPYVPSTIALDSSELPFSASFTDLDSDITIREKGGEILNFGVVKVRGLTMQLKHKDGSFAKINEEVTIIDVKETAYVGYDGLTYFTDIGNISKIEGTSCASEGDCCRFNYEIPAKADDFLIDLGTVICE